MRSVRRVFILTAALLPMALMGSPVAADPSSGAKEAEVPDHAVHYLEIVTPDSEAVRDFYSEAYGYEFSGPTPELGGAFFASMPNGSLLGIRAPLRDTEEPIVRTYLRVSDLQQATKRAAELGAQIAIESMEIPGHGKIAIYLLGGIEQGLWQIP